jgi:DNA invertase Pin-like site-specific DNA recombinase
MTLRCAIYARYSSENQREASIDDQLRICRARAEREGWQVADVFADAALSGATTLRPGYQALLAAMRAGQLDLVLAESLDRFSRDQEHIAAFHKQAVFAGVRLLTLAEGEVSELHVGLKGTMGALYLKDLADKTRRGLEGRVRQGRSVGRLCYGYRRIRRLRPDGEPERGLREIDPAEAAVVRRIFREYAAGRSPRAIARDLNEEGVPAPDGTAWSDRTLRGRAARHEGLLRNPLYAGRQLWNRTRTLKDPATGKVRRRPNAEADHVVLQAPELRIIDEPLWQQVQARLAAEAAPKRAASKVAAFWQRRRPQYLLTGKVVCGVCGSPFYARGRDYLGCPKAHQYLCTNPATVRRGPLQARVLQALQHQLMDPDLAAEFAAEFTREWNRLAAEAGAAALARADALREVERQIANLLDAITEGIRAPGLQARLDELQARHAALLAEAAAAPPALPALHPNLAALYRTRVARLEQALAAGDAPDVLEAARALIDKVVIYPPGEGGGGPRIELVGDLPAMLEACGAGWAREPAVRDVLGAFASSVKAGKGTSSPKTPSYLFLTPFPSRGPVVSRQAKPVSPFG